eukprot:CAMPEP_0196137680 /NCGR_PEP_ID=MMETSP0910-20130528/5591_1 /TAXON_ID=49265 /ORGANISM="Thalassiosira rotula, Strain GSO102" /LENGTH=379 /DNA_ID=CAMNT_0041398173 /DNA_START=17 /DNA_END=1156 /DNA_ORIENTATION=-
MKLLKPSSRQIQEKEELNQHEEDINRGYHECVEEIKNEHKVLGSLELHHEAMRRLKEKQGSFRRCVSEPKRFLSIDVLLNKTDLVNRFQYIGRRKSGDARNSFDFNDSPESVISGRRMSKSMKGFDRSLIAAQVLQDLELSDDSDCEDEASSLKSPRDDCGSSPPAGEQEEENVDVGSCRPSIFRKCSLLFLGLGGGGEDDCVDRRHSAIKKRSSTIKMDSTRRGRMNSSRCVSNGEEESDISAAEKFASSRGEGEVPAPEARDQNIGNGGAESDAPNEDGGKSAKEQPLSIHSEIVNRRSGRRRATHSASNAKVSRTPVRRSSSSFLARDAADEDKGFTGSTLICSFRHRNSSFLLDSCDLADDLICGWERKSSLLSD